MSLTKEQRDKLPAGEFAVPEKRALPIHDENHVRMAWKMVDKTKDLSPEERSSAKKKILKKAQNLGIDTSDWDIEASNDNDFDETQENIKAMQFNAMAIKFPEDDKNHPNKVPFSGILTRLDEPSDNPIGGSNGKRVLIPKEVGNEALKTLLGMAIDFTEDLDAHDSQKKIGLITEANIEGNAILIKGFFYGADFPNEVKRIQAEKSLLGFSYEAQVKLRSLDDDPLIIKSCVFTGAAVLYKDKAGYTSTALNAKAEKLKMSDEILNMLKEIKQEFQKEINELKASVAEKSLSAAAIIDRVKPLAENLRAAASQMCAEGIGLHPDNGHAIAVRRIADHMEAESILGRLPHSYQASMYAGKAENDTDKPENDEEEIDMKELNELKAQLSASLEKIASLETQVTDLKNQKFEAAEQPERKTTSNTSPVSEKTKRLLTKINIQAGSDNKIDRYRLDEALAKTSLKNQERISLKAELVNAGMLSAV